MFVLNITLIVLSIAFCIFLLTPNIRNSPTWQATATPLASIIGSGFLVVLPLLGHEIGHWAVIGMAGIVLISYLIGHVLRFNIGTAEPLLSQDTPPASLRIPERIADIFLAIAYIISVTFYIRLLADFVMKGAGLTDAELYARILATVVLLFIGGVGIWRGLGGLEKLEEYAVSVKLSIIFALIVGLLYHNGQFFLSGQSFPDSTPNQSWWHTMRAFAGMLIVVQGFETSRYLGEEYDADMRIKTMSWSQIISGIIYILFVGLATILLPSLPDKVSDTAVIDLVGVVATVLPALLVLAALMSQFSAAVADTVGCGGLAVEMSEKRVKHSQSYAIIITLAIILTWTANIFQVISLASRAFALYYLIEMIIAWNTAGHALEGQKKWWMRAKIAIAGAILLFVVIFAIPAE